MFFYPVVALVLGFGLMTFPTATMILVLVAAFVFIAKLPDDQAKEEKRWNGKE